MAGIRNLKRKNQGGTPATADLSVTITGSIQAVITSNISQQIVVENNGNSRAEDVFAYIYLPVGINFVSAVDGVWDSGTRTITWNVGQLKSGSYTKQFVLTSDDIDDYTINAMVEGFLPDPDLISNTYNKVIEYIGGSPYPQFRSSNTTDISTNQTSHSINMPSGIQAGDLLIAVVGYGQYSPTISSYTSGRSQLLPQTGNFVVLYKTATGGDTLTINYTAGIKQQVLTICVSGLNPIINTASQGTNVTLQNIGFTASNKYTLFTIRGRANGASVRTGTVALFSNLLELIPATKDTTTSVISSMNREFDGSSYGFESIPYSTSPGGNNYRLYLAICNS